MNEQTTTEQPAIEGDEPTGLGWTHELFRAPADSGNPLDVFALDELESAIRDAVSPGLHRVVLAWGERVGEERIGAFAEALEPHLRTRVPDFAAVVRHTLADMDSIAGICAEHRAADRPGSFAADPEPDPAA